jgi:F-type H+-transporting ATPase subunit a
MRLVGTLLLSLALGAAPLAAQETHEATAAGADTAHVSAAEKPVDIITPHITDANEIELPYWKAPFFKAYELPRWKPLFYIKGKPVDISPTKHVVMMLFAAFLLMVVLIGAARAHARHTHAVGRPKGFAAGIEAMVLYLRNEVILPNVGHHGEGFVPFVLTLFFFILFANLLGLVPYGSTATGNIAVTATLAVITFVVVEISGMRAQGAGYLNTVFYWNTDLPMYMRVPMFAIMTPVEIIGKFTKPFALAIRLFANMTAGHIVLLAFMGLFFAMAGNRGLAATGAVAPLLMAIAVMMLELFVAFLQAFIFTLLASVFIGQIREAHH